MCIVFANGPGQRVSLPGRVIPKTKKMILDAALLDTQRYKRASSVKWSNPGKEFHPSQPLGVVAIEKGAFGSPSTNVVNFTYI